MKKTKVIINSVTIKDTEGSPDPNKLISWEYNKNDSIISEIEIIVPKNIDSLVDLQNGQRVEVWGGWTTSTDKRFFYGFIDNISPEGALIKVLCKNEMSLLVRKNVNHVYDENIDDSAGQISEIAKDLIETYGTMTASTQNSGTATDETIFQFKCINTDVFERVNALKTALNWDLFYDDHTRTVHFEPGGTTDSGITLTVGTEIVGMPKWEFDNSEMVNDLRIDGASIQTMITETGQIGTDTGYETTGIELTKTPDSVELFIDASDPPTTQRKGGSKDYGVNNYFYVDRENRLVVPASSFTSGHYAIVNYVWSSPAPTRQNDQTSIDNYGPYEKQIEFSDVVSVEDAIRRGENILNKRKDPLVNAKLLVKSEAANIPDRGDQVAIVDTKTPTVNGSYMSGDYVVTGIKYRFPSAIEELEIGDKPLKMVNWQGTVEERLKRLEEQFIRNQDILVEIENIENGHVENFKYPNPRYFKVLQRTVSSDTIWGNFNWNAKNWDNSYDNSESPIRVIQHENIYTENFIDEDFESSNTTADWSTTGSVEFTSGEIAESDSVDLNNGTITAATLTSTEVSGSFDYEMTADGTNWESVTSGVAHNFTDTGTDLRWRVAENATSTGEISQIKIEDYH